MYTRTTIGIWRALFLAVLAGSGPGALAQERPLAGNLAAICAEGSTTAWLEVRGGARFRIRASEFFPAFKRDLGLGPYDSMALRRVTTDDLGYAHYRYDQYHRGIRVSGGSYILHELNGAVVRGNGTIMTGVEIPASGIMPRERAAGEALAAVRGRGYEPANDLAADSSGTLIVVRDAARASSVAGGWRLAYRFHAWSRDRAQSDYVYIDAAGGRPARFGSTRLYCAASSAPTYFYGARQIHTAYDPAIDGWVLRDECAGDGAGVVQTHYMDDGGVERAYISPTSDWSGYALTAGPTAQWAGEKALDYWWGAFGRRSYDNSNSVLTLVLRGSTSWNTDWRYISIAGGYSDDQWSQATVDIVGHEFTHGVQQVEIGVLDDNASFETAALYESYADIFGAMAGYAAGYGSYDIGAATGVIMRRMSDPHSISHPDTYGGMDPYWNADPETGEPHVMGEVSNHCFYLLAEGGSGTNANGAGYGVTGIGRESAAKIAHRAMVTYFTTGTTFKDARVASIRAARDLFGDCSFEQLQTARAWEAVGVTADARTSFQICRLFQSGGADVYEGYSTIYGAGCAPPAVSTCEVVAGADVTFRAGDSVVLRPGFHAAQGSTFHGYIDCSAGLFKVATPPSPAVGPSPPPSAASSLRAFPSPAAGRVRISYRVVAPGPVRLILYDALGREVGRIADEVHRDAGLYDADLAVDRLPSGVYWISMVSGDGVAIERFVVER